MKHLFLLLTLLSFSLTALAQQKVTGKVKDSSGEPVIGASVVVKGNNTMGTITDFDGNFELNVSSSNDFNPNRVVSFNFSVFKYTNTDVWFKIESKG